MSLEKLGKEYKVFSNLNNGFYNEGILKVGKIIDNKTIFGIYDTNKEDWILPCVYDYIEDKLVKSELDQSSNDYITIKKGKYAALINILGDIIIPFSSYNDISSDIVDDVIPVYEENKGWYFIDFKENKINNKIYTNIKYQYYNDYTGAYKLWKPDLKYGIADVHGNEIIPCIYDNILYSNEVYIVTNNKELKGIIDLKGKEIVPVQYKSISNLKLLDYTNTDLAIIVNKSCRHGIINIKTGEFVLDIEYDDIKLKHNILITDKIKKNNLYSYNYREAYKISNNKLKKINFPESHNVDHISIINNKLIFILKSDIDKYALFNDNGNQISDWFSSLSYINFSDLFLTRNIVNNKIKYGFIYFDGKEAISPVYDSVEYITRYTDLNIKRGAKVHVHFVKVHDEYGDKIINVYNNQVIASSESDEHIKIDHYTCTFIRFYKYTEFGPDAINVYYINLHDNKLVEFNKGISDMFYLIDKENKEIYVATSEFFGTLSTFKDAMIVMHKNQRIHYESILSKLSYELAFKIREVI